MTQKSQSSFLTLLIGLLFTTTIAMAQSDCQTEEPPYSGFFGVYPRPQNDTLPDGSILFSDGLPAACQGQPYTFDLTVIMPDSIYAGEFLPALTIFVDIDRAVLTNPNSIGLPSGFTFETSATNWTIYGGVVECIRITGMSNQIGEYPLLLKITAYSPDIFFPVPIEFGGYVLRVVAPQEECFTSIKDTHSITFDQTYNAPNPFQDQTSIHLTSKQNTSLTLSIFDIAGKKVHERSLQAQIGENEWTIDAHLLSLQSGVYLYTLGNGTDIVGGKMMVK
ncbi:MAG: T9SS type A sorting domain-containing protein [Chitinophagales bacterium]